MRWLVGRPNKAPKQSACHASPGPHTCTMPCTPITKSPRLNWAAILRSSYQQSPVCCPGWALCGDTVTLQAARNLYGLRVWVIYVTQMHRPYKLHAAGSVSLSAHNAQPVILRLPLLSPASSLCYCPSSLLPISLLLPLLSSASSLCHLHHPSCLFIP